MRLLPAATVVASLVCVAACTPIGLPPSSPPSSAPVGAAPVAEPPPVPTSAPVPTATQTPSAPAAGPKTVMVLGDSLCAAPSADAGSYRHLLYDQLTSESYQLTMVGSQRDPDVDAARGSHECHGGYTVAYPSQVGSLTQGIAGWVGTAQPDIALLTIGVNDNYNIGDLIPGYDPQTDAIGYLAELLDALHEASPQTEVLVSNLPQVGWDENFLSGYTDQIPALVAARADYARFVDVHAAGIAEGDTTDGLHRTRQGAVKLAGVWADALRPQLAAAPAAPAPASAAPQAPADPSGSDVVTTGAGPAVQVFIDDMAGDAEGVPAGVPDGYDWKYASRMGLGIDNTNRPYVNAWGHLYPAEGTTPPPNCRVEIRDIGASAVGADGVWRLVQSSTAVDGAAFPASYQGDNGTADVRTTADGASSIGRPPGGFNHHFWPTGDRGLLPSSLAGIATHFKARLAPAAGQVDDCDQAEYLLAASADYYGAVNGYAPVLGDVAIGRFKTVEREWRWFTMATPTSAELLANPPFAP